MLKLILIALSFIFGLLSIRHLRTFDVHEKEPFGKMLAVTIWGGVVSVVLSLFLAVLEEMSEKVVQKAESRWWCPTINRVGSGNSS